MDCAFIDDGYTRKSRVKGEPGLYPAVTFSWRPAQNVGERVAMMSSVSKIENAAESERRAARYLARHLLSWDLCDRRGTPRQIDETSVFALHPKLFFRLYSIVVTMYEAPDENLDDAEWDALQDRAALDGVGVMEAARKN